MDKRVNNVNNELIRGCSVIKDGVTKTVKKCNVVASVEKQVMSRGCLFPSLMKKTQGAVPCERRNPSCQIHWAGNLGLNTKVFRFSCYGDFFPKKKNTNTI